MSDTLYPLTPGHRGVDTSAEAADAIEPKADRLRKQCLRLIRDQDIQSNKVGLTCLEVTQLIGEPQYNINPRLSELRAQGMIKDSGVRRVNEYSGRKAIAWIPGRDSGADADTGNAPPKSKTQREIYVRGMRAALGFFEDADTPEKVRECLLNAYERVEELE